MKRLFLNNIAARYCLFLSLLICFSTLAKKTNPASRSIAAKDIKADLKRDNTAAGGAPNITYATPPKLIVGVEMAPLIPNNAGGDIPAIAYAMVSKLSGSGKPGATNGDANTTSFNSPQGLAADAQGNIYVADFDNNIIREVSRDGNTITLAGDGTAGRTNGQALKAQFNGPAFLAIDAAGNIYVADNKNFQIRKINPAGQVSVLAGDGTEGYENGPGDKARFSNLAANGPIPLL